jgi:hypothetical protein
MINLIYHILLRKLKRISAHLDLGMVEGEPEIYCVIDNYSAHTVTIQTCHLLVNDKPSSLVSWNLPLPDTFTTGHGGAFCFHATPLLTTAVRIGLEQIKLQAYFQDTTGKTYLSRPMTIETQPQGLSVFEDQREHDSEPVNQALFFAHRIADQLDHQLVKMPHILLGLVQEQSGVAGLVLRELGLNEEFLFNMAKGYPNIPRDHYYPDAHRSIEIHNLLDEFMVGEARKMRQRRQGTGHMLLGLTKQRNEAFLTILKDLDVQPRKVRKLVFQRLKTDLYPLDHPTLPPQGIKGFIWAIWYSFTHSLLKAYFRVIERLYPDIEI